MAIYLTNNKYITIIYNSLFFDANYNLLIFIIYLRKFYF